MLFAPLFVELVLLFAVPDDVFAAPVVPVAGVGAASVVPLLLPFDLDVGGGAFSDIVAFFVLISMLLPCSRKEVELIARSAVAVAVAFVLCGRERCWKSRVDLIRTCLHCLSGGPTDDEVESRSTSSWIILLPCLFLAILLVFYIHPFIYLVSTFIIYKEIRQLSWTII